jgi:hypothetical protein
MRQQEVLGKINHILSVDTKRAAYKMEKIRGDIQTHRQQGDLISIL